MSEPEVLLSLAVKPFHPGDNGNKGEELRSQKRLNGC